MYRQISQSKVTPLIESPTKPISEIKCRHIDNVFNICALIVLSNKFSYCDIYIYLYINCTEPYQKLYLTQH